MLKSLEPSLWNSSLGRRTFLKRTGAATVGTAIALHGFRTEVLASFSDANGLYWKISYAKFEHQFSKVLQTHWPENLEHQAWIDEKTAEVSQLCDQKPYAYEKPMSGSPSPYTETVRYRYYTTDVELVAHWRKVTVTIDELGPTFPGTNERVVKYTVRIENWWVWGDDTGPLDENGCPEVDPGEEKGHDVYDTPPEANPGGTGHDPWQ